MLPGVYILVIRGGPATLTIGALGERLFVSGYYCYVGSALGPGGLSRVRRHIRCAASHDANCRWHIDYLLTHPGFSLVQAWCAPTPDRVECSLAAAVPLPPVPRFGSSDCHCTGHLFFSPDDPANIIRQAFRAVSLRPRCHVCRPPGQDRKPDKKDIIPSVPDNLTPESLNREQPGGMSDMIKVAINGYGTIGKRVADAAAAQKDMEIIGVSKTRPTAEALVAVKRGYPVYIADISKKGDFEKAGIPVAGSIEEMVQKADIIVDATPGKIGVANRPLYEKYQKKAIWQGGEGHEVAGFSFNAHANYREAIGRQFVRVVSCNTTGLCRVIKAIDDAVGVAKVRAVMVRRGADPHVVKKGPIDAVVLDPPTIPSHHGPDVNTVLPGIDIITMAMIVPTTQMHMHAIHMELKRDADREEILKIMRSHSRIGLIQGSTGIKSTAELKEYIMDLGRPRSDLWENGIFEASVATVGRELFFFQAIHQEADVVTENIDAIRAMAGDVTDPERSIAMTNESLGFVAV